jgi:hypothetical protein
MSIGRVVGLLLLVVVIYAVITQPTASAAMTRDGVGHLGDAGSSLTTFMTALVGSATDNGSSGVTSSSQVDEVPDGGVSTGDGSYPG